MNTNESNNSPASFLVSAVAGAVLLGAGFFGAVYFTGDDKAQLTETTTNAVVPEQDDNSATSSGDQDHDDSSNSGNQSNDDSQQPQEPNEGEKADSQDEPVYEGGGNEENVPDEGDDPEPGGGDPVVPGPETLAPPWETPCQPISECLPDLPVIPVPTPPLPCNVMNCMGPVQIIPIGPAPPPTPGPAIKF
jgi:hypothetical protein